MIMKIIDRLQNLPHASSSNRMQLVITQPVRMLFQIFQDCALNVFEHQVELAFASESVEEVDNVVGFQLLSSGSEEWPTYPHEHQYTI